MTSTIGLSRGLTVHVTWTKSEIGPVLDLMIKNALLIFKIKGYWITVSDNLKTYLLDTYYDPIDGARSLQKAVETHIVDVVTNEIVVNSLKPGVNFTLFSPDEPKQIQKI